MDLKDLRIKWLLIFNSNKIIPQRLVEDFKRDVEKLKSFPEWGLAMEPIINEQ